MTQTTVKPDQLSDELLDHEVSCGGIMHHSIARSCSRAAVLRSFGHGCIPMPSQGFKCLECWKVWYACHVAMTMRRGIRCRNCRRVFTTVESFSDYRPF